MDQGARACIDSGRGRTPQGWRAGCCCSTTTAGPGLNKPTQSRAPAAWTAPLKRREHPRTLRKYSLCGWATMVSCSVAGAVTVAKARPASARRAAAAARPVAASGARRLPRKLDSSDSAAWGRVGRPNGWIVACGEGVGRAAGEAGPCRRQRRRQRTGSHNAPAGRLP